MRRFHVLLMIAILVSCRFPAQANSYEWIPLKKLPAEADIVVFANRPVFNRSETLSRKEAMRFLTAGTLHTDPQDAVKITQDNPRGKPMPGATGVMLAKTGRLYFWILFDERLMFIATDDGKSCFLSLPQPGSTLKADPPRGDKNSYRTLLPPSAEDVRWFFNDEPLPPVAGR
jgi:hypothetical protein